MASRKFFRSSSSPRITAFLSTQEHQGMCPCSCSSRSGCIKWWTGRMSYWSPRCIDWCQRRNGWRGATMCHHAVALGGCNHDPSESRHENLRRGTLLSHYDILWYSMILWVIPSKWQFPFQSEVPQILQPTIPQSFQCIPNHWLMISTDVQEKTWNKQHMPQLQ